MIRVHINEVGHSAKHSTLSLRSDNSQWERRWGQSPTAARRGGDRSCGLPSHFHLPGPHLGKLHHKCACKSGSMQHTKQSLLATEVSGHLSSGPQLPAAISILLFHDASRPSQNTPDDRISSFQKTQDWSSSLRLGTLHPGPGFLHFPSSQVTLASQCAGSVCSTDPYLLH